MKKFHCHDLPMVFSNADKVILKNHMILLNFSGPRRVLSTSAWNGGIQEDLKCVFNYDLSHNKTVFCELLEPTLAGHMRRLGEVAGLPSQNSGLCTAAQMKNLSIIQECWEDICVTAIVTAGIDENGGRAGDPASWQEKNGELGVPVGTINLLLHFNCNLSPGALAGALLTATEAKAVAIQELQLPSKVSCGIATGSGTDGAILVCDPTSTEYRTDCGKHSKLGEMIGQTVLHGVKDALFLQTEASVKRVRDALRLLGRFGLCEEYLKAYFPESSSEELQVFCKEEEIWTSAAIYANLLDLENWGIFTHKQVRKTAEKLFSMRGKNELEAFISYMKKIKYNQERKKME